MGIFVGFDGHTKHEHPFRRLASATLDVTAPATDNASIDRVDRV
jgi:hypothetical protein